MSRLNAPGRMTEAQEQHMALAFVDRVPPVLAEALNAPFGPQDIQQDSHLPGDRFVARYVPVTHVIRRLNDVLGVGGWSYRMLNWFMSPCNSQVLVHGELTLHVAGEGWTWHAVKSAIGQSRINGDRQRGVMENFGFDLKAASSDGLRKAATMIGVGLHLYERDESGFQGQPPAQPAQPPAAATTDPIPAHLSQMPAIPSQVASVVKLFGDMNVPPQQWVPMLGLQSPDQLTRETAMAILTGRHPLVLHLSGGQPAGGLIHRDT
jgi:hypothetical protein